MRNLQSFQNISGFSNTNAVEAVVTLQSYIKSLSGLVVYYPMDETSGSTTVNQAPDTLGTLNGTITGATINQEGQSGASYSFDGVGDYTTLSGYNFYGTYTSHSVVMMIKCAAADDTKLLAFGNTADDAPLWQMVTTGSGGVSLYIRNDGNNPVIGFSGRASTSNTFCNSQWHQIVWTDDNGTAKLYLDGVQDATNFTYTRSGVFTFNTLSYGAMIRVLVTANYLGHQQHAVLVNGILSQAQITKLAQLAGLA